MQMCAQHEAELIEAGKRIAELEVQAKRVEELIERARHLSDALRGLVEAQAGTPEQRQMAAIEAVYILDLIDVARG